MSKPKKRQAEPGLTVQCEFDKVLVQPDVCLACENPASENRIHFSIYNTFYTQKMIVKFPVCEACYEAKEQYVNLLPIFVIGIIMIAFSIYSLINQPNYIPFSRTLFISLGVVWLIILLVFLLKIFLQAKRQNTPEVISKRNELQKAVEAKKLIAPKKNQQGLVTLYFNNKRFARAFKKLNHGKYV